MASTPSKVRPIFAIIVGINAYMALPHLRKAVDDANAVFDFLCDDLKVPKENIILLLDAQATKDAILTAIRSLPSNAAFQPDSPVLFFFSGLAGQAQLEQAIKNSGRSRIGMICPVDTNVATDTGRQTGISDSTLVDLFNQISRSHGNNITLLLDCDSEIFDWGDPKSCVVVTPVDASEAESGGTFVKSLLDVLRAENKAGMIQFLTVQSFAQKIQIYSNGKCTVNCFGQSADCFLLDRTSGGAYHSFILGWKDVGGEITLAAGAAHGVTPGTHLALFLSNVKDEQNAKRDDLVVRSATATSAVLRRLSHDSIQPIPVVFYAAETQYPGKTIRVTVKGDLPSNEVFQPENFPCVLWRDKTEDANLTLEFKDDKVSFYWNGIISDEENLRGDYLVGEFATDQPRAGRMLRSAARFTHHLSRTSPANTSLARGLRVEFIHVKDYEENKSSDKNILQNGYVTLKLGDDETVGPYCLVLHNDTEDDLWPYIFTFDPRSLCILPWYSPSPSVKQPPLKAGESQAVGYEDDDGLVFELYKGRPSISYIRVFATKERTDFSSIMQQWKSPTEDRVRELETTAVRLVQDDLMKTEDDDVPRVRAGRHRRLNLTTAGWAALRIPIILKPAADLEGRS